MKVRTQEINTQVKDGNSESTFTLVIRGNNHSPEDITIATTLLNSLVTIVSTNRETGNLDKVQDLLTECAVISMGLGKREDLSSELPNDEVDQLDSTDSSNETDLPNQEPLWKGAELEIDGQVVIIEPFKNRTDHTSMRSRRPPYTAFKVIDPQGRIRIISNFTRFCEENDLVKGQYSEVIGQVSYQEWRKDPRPETANAWTSMHSTAAANPHRKIERIGWVMAPHILPELEPYKELYKG